DEGLALERDRAFLRGIEAGDRVDQRRLAGAVGPDEAVDLALLDAHRDIRQRLHAAEAATDVFQRQDEPVPTVMARSQLACASDADRLATRRRPCVAASMGARDEPCLLRRPASSPRGLAPVAARVSAEVALDILERI